MSVLRPVRRRRSDGETKVGIIPSGSSGELASGSRGVALSGGSYGQTVVSSKYDSGPSGPALGPRPGGNWDMTRAMAQGYERSTAFYRAIEAKAVNAANRHVHLYRPDGTHEDDGICDLLNGQANPIEKGKELRRRASLQLDTSPRGVFIELTRSRSNKVVRIDLLPPGRTYPVPAKGGAGVDHFEMIPLGAKHGEVVKIDTENVIWLINRHPDNPWRNMTALETLSLTVEIDYFARLYARQYMINDGRPGGIINVKGDLEDDEADRIERKFGGGPSDAGRNVVLNVDDVNYQEVGRATPQESGYQKTREAAQDEVFLGTGVPKSVAGDASGRTFSNADAELEGFWLITEIPWMGALLEPWQHFAADGMQYMHDVSDVAVLERYKKEKEDRYLNLFKSGVITLDEFREATGRQVFNLPWTRALWLPGNYWLPTNPNDQEGLAELQKDHAPPPAAPAQPALGGASAVVDGHGSSVLNPLGGLHPALVSAIHGESGSAPGSAAALEAALAVPKALPAGPPDDPAAVDKLTDALVALAEQRADAFVAKVTSARARRGTRLWEPGTNIRGNPQRSDKPLPASWAADADSWGAAAQQLALEHLRDAAIAAGQEIDDEAGPQLKLLHEVKADGEPADPPDDTEDVPAPDAPGAFPDELVTGPAELLGAAVAGYAQLLARTVALHAHNAAATVDSVRETVDNFTATLRHRMQVNARNAVLATYEGVQQHRVGLLSKLGGKLFDKQWWTMLDARVRPAHQLAHGQKVPAGTPFTVGGESLHYPHDPAGSAWNTINCRCRVVYRLRRRP